MNGKLSKNRIRCALGLVLLCALLDGCSGPPDEATGRRAIEDRIAAQSQGRIRLNSFKKVNGQSAEINSVKVYTLEYEATIDFQQQCRWNVTAFAGALMDTEATFRTSPALDPSAGALAQLMEQSTNPGLDIAGGQRMKLAGSIQFEQKEQGWAVDSIKMTSVSPVAGNTSASGGPVANGSSGGAGDDAARPAVQNHDPKTEARNACINNLRLIDGAKQQWALENKKGSTDIPSMLQLKAYLARGSGDFPECPSGGFYTVRAVSTAPTCTIEGHVLP